MSKGMPGQICNLCPTRSRCISVLNSRFIELTLVEAGISCNTFLSRNNYHTDIITAKESNCENKVHVVCYRLNHIMAFLSKLHGIVSYWMDIASEMYGRM